jgi:hypothetical protein
MVFKVKRFIAFTHHKDKQIFILRLNPSVRYTLIALFVLIGLIIIIVPLALIPVYLSHRGRKKHYLFVKFI